VLVYERVWASLGCHAIESIVLGVKPSSILRLEIHTVFASKVTCVLNGTRRVSTITIDDSSLDATEAHSCVRGEVNRS
jgi:hypothetical protein